MGLVLKMAFVAMAAGLAAGMPGCEKSRDEMRPDMDKVMSGEQGLQSRDLREMTSRMAPDLVQIPEVVANPQRITIVMMPIENKTESSPTRDLTIYVARLRTLLNGAARDRLAFVEEQAWTNRMQAQELGNRDPFEDASRNGVPVNPRIEAQFVLSGTFYEMRNNRTSYYLCTFRLSDLRTGRIVWENSYETRTLN